MQEQVGEGGHGVTGWNHHNGNHRLLALVIPKEPFLLCFAELRKFLLNPKRQLGIKVLLAQWCVCCLF